jgi:hypothetical protein
MHAKTHNDTQIVHASVDTLMLHASESDLLRRMPETWRMCWRMER